MRNELSILLFGAAVFSVATAKVFHLKEDHFAVYHMEIDANSLNQKVHHHADFYVAKAQADEYTCKVRNVHIDQQLADQFDHSDVIEITRRDMVFTFDETGCLEFRVPEDLEEPHLIVYEPKMIEMIQKGRFEFKKRIFVPYSMKKCKAQFTITELEDTYNVDITPEKGCIVSIFKSFLLARC